MIKTFQRSLPVVAFLLAGSQVAHSQELTGNIKLACEAVLCLSSGNGSQYGECSASIRKYFSFNDPRSFIQDRLNFLNLCPASDGIADNGTVDSNVPALINAIANGAGRCDAKFLNVYNKVDVNKVSCETSSFNREVSCTNTTVRMVAPTKPKYCQAYEDATYVDKESLQVNYVGDMYHGGYWADSRDYDKALQKYNDQYQKIPAGVRYIYNGKITTDVPANAKKTGIIKNGSN